MFKIDYRVSIPTTLYLDVSGIITPGLKSIGYFQHAHCAD